MHEWLASSRDRLAAALGDDPANYDLPDADIEKLLEVARDAAHGSGDRTNAPLLTYLLGRATVRHPDRDLATLVSLAVGAQEDELSRGA